MTTTITSLDAPRAGEGPMTPAQFEVLMRATAADGDPEGRHRDADALMVEVLRSLGYGAGCDVFEKMGKWYA